MEKQQELGALWVRTGAKGEYMTGTLTIDGIAIKVVAFTNKNKKNEKEPDWRILRSVPKPQTENVVPDTLDASEIPF